MSLGDKNAAVVDDNNIGDGDFELATGIEEVGVKGMLFVPIVTADVEHVVALTIVLLPLDTVQMLEGEAAGLRS